MLLKNEETVVQNKKLQDQKLRRQERRQRYLKVQTRLNEEAERRLEAQALLQYETDGYLKADFDEKKTYQIKQEEIYPHLDIGTKAKVLDLSLQFGPYCVKYTRNGRYMLAGGHKGSLAVVDCQTLKPLTEINVHETVRDVTFCHDHTIWAAAQKKYVYLYDHTGLELHCLREHMLTYKMEFLPYHLLLTTIGEFGELRWIDISTGLVPAAYKTKQGSCDTMCQNPFTAVIGLGHAKGCVSFWTPNFGKPVLQFLGHKGKVSCMQHVSTYAIATAGFDGYWKIWDIRSLKQPLTWRPYFGGVPKSITVSQTGLVALGFGGNVQIWKDPLTEKSNLYMTHVRKKTIFESLAFQPYEDFLCVGHNTGIETVVVPGSCHSNFDSYAVDPYETKSQRREREIHSLLDKLPASTISLNPEQLGGLITKVKSFDDEKKSHVTEEATTFGLNAQSAVPKKQSLKNKKHMEMFVRKRKDIYLAKHKKIAKEVNYNSNKLNKEQPALTRFWNKGKRNLNTI